MAGIVDVTPDPDANPDSDARPASSVAGHDPEEEVAVVRRRGRRAGADKVDKLTSGEPQSLSTKTAETLKKACLVGGPLATLAHGETLHVKDAVLQQLFGMCMLAIMHIVPQHSVEDVQGLFSLTEEEMRYAVRACTVSMETTMNNLLMQLLTTGRDIASLDECIAAGQAGADAADEGELFYGTTVLTSTRCASISDTGAGTKFPLHAAELAFRVAFLLLNDTEAQDQFHERTSSAQIVQACLQNISALCTTKRELCVSGKAAVAMTGVRAHPACLVSSDHSGVHVPVHVDVPADAEAACAEAIAAIKNKAQAIADAAAKFYLPDRQTTTMGRGGFAAEWFVRETSSAPPTAQKGWTTGKRKRRASNSIFGLVDSKRRKSQVKHGWAATEMKAPEQSQERRRLLTLCNSIPRAPTQAIEYVHGGSGLLLPTFAQTFAGAHEMVAAKAYECLEEMQHRKDDPAQHNQKFRQLHKWLGVYKLGKAQHAQRGAVDPKEFVPLSLAGSTPLLPTLPGVTKELLSLVTSSSYVSYQAITAVKAPGVAVEVPDVGRAHRALAAASACLASEQVEAGAEAEAEVAPALGGDPKLRGRKGRRTRRVKSPYAPARPGDATIPMVLDDTASAKGRTVFVSISQLTFGDMPLLKRSCAVLAGTADEARTPDQRVLAHLYARTVGVLLQLAEIKPGLVGLATSVVAFCLRVVRSTTTWPASAALVRMEIISKHEKLLASLTEASGGADPAERYSCSSFQTSLRIRNLSQDYARGRQGEVAHLPGTPSTLQIMEKMVGDLVRYAGWQQNATPHHCAGPNIKPPFVVMHDGKVVYERDGIPLALVRGVQGVKLPYTQTNPYDAIQSFSDVDAARRKVENKKRQREQNAGDARGGRATARPDHGWPDVSVSVDSATPSRLHRMEMNKHAAATNRAEAVLKAMCDRMHELCSAASAASARFGGTELAATLGYPAHRTVASEKVFVGAEAVPMLDLLAPADAPCEPEGEGEVLVHALEPATVSDDVLEPPKEACSDDVFMSMLFGRSTTHHSRPAPTATRGDDDESEDDILRLMDDIKFEGFVETPAPQPLPMYGGAFQFDDDALFQMNLGPTL